MKSPALQTLSVSAFLAMGITFPSYFLIIVRYFWWIRVFMIGYLRDNGLQITLKQFPDVYKMIEESSAALDLKNPHKIFLVQTGGVLNAFASRFPGGDKFTGIFSHHPPLPKRLRQVAKTTGSPV